MKNSSVGTYFTNRALCQIKLQKWNQAVSDARRAIELESNSMKGHFFLGKALFELEQYEDAIRHVQKAHDLAKEKKLNFGDEITFLLRMAKKKRWSQFEDKRIAEEIELQSYLNNLISQDRERQLNAIKQQRNDQQTDEEVSELEQKVHAKCDQHIQDLNEMFSQLDIRRKKREVPDYLCGKINFEIMREPMITPSGITYDRRDIEEHLQRVGHFDPITRHPLTMEQLVPNLSMKEVIDAFLAENEWAYDY